MLTRIFLAIAILFTFTISSYSNVKTGSLTVGDKVTDFTITNYDGATYTLSNSGSKYTVIIFMSTECPFVQPYTDRLINLTNQFGSQGIAFWGINSNNTEPTEQVMNHATERKYNFPVLKDNDNVVADLFGAARTPEVFVVDNNSMTLVYHGRIDDNKEADKVTSNDLQNALTDILTGKEVAVNNTKAFGCSIKRKSTE